MTPIYQSIDDTKDGNCLAACLASIFEKDITYFPEREIYRRDKRDWVTVINDYLIPMGVYLMLDKTNKVTPIGYHLIIGTVEGEKHEHCQVGLNGKVVHEPSLDPWELVDVYYGVFVKIIN
jgi:hypothetical protein